MMPPSPHPPACLSLANRGPNAESDLVNIGLTVSMVTSCGVMPVTSGLSTEFGAPGSVISRTVIEMVAPSSGMTRW